MAQFKLTDFIDIGTNSYHTKTSWKITRDVAGSDIIDESLEDSVNLYNWASPLPDGAGGYYSDLDKIHLWVRVHTLETTSPWYYAGYANQNDQTFIITSNNIKIDTLNSIIAGIQ